MDCAHSPLDRVLVRGVCTLGAFLAATTAPSAQAWVPPAGFGEIHFVYQNVDNTGHLLTDGSLLPGFDSVSRGLLIAVDYAVTDRFSFTATVPYIGAKYLGPEPSFFGLELDDCLCWNRGWQDVTGTARYNLFTSATGAFALTPSVSVGVPSHDYNFFGEAVIGRNLFETRVAIDAGQRLDAISTNLLGVGPRLTRIRRPFAAGKGRRCRPGSHRSGRPMRPDSTRGRIAGSGLPSGKSGSLVRHRCSTASPTA